MVEEGKNGKEEKEEEGGITNRDLKQKLRRQKEKYNVVAGKNNSIYTRKKKRKTSTFATQALFETKQARPWVSPFPPSMDNVDSQVGGWRPHGSPPSVASFVWHAWGNVSI